jgi:hypothetical protein
MSEIVNKNKIEISVERQKDYDALIKKAQEANATEDITDEDDFEGLITIKEVFTLRELFDLTDAETKYKLYKEVFLIPKNGQKSHIELEEDVQVVFRRVVPQKEIYDAKHAIAVADKLGIDILDEAGKKVTPKVSEKK